MQSGTQWAAKIAQDLAAHGYAIVSRALPDAVIAALREEARRRDACGVMRVAGVGRGSARRVLSDVRGDRIAWLEPDTVLAAERAYFDAMRCLRETLNRELMAGVVELEAHYAIYPPGARYARHYDRFRDDDARVVSLVTYLNDGWSEGDGGALRLYTDDRGYVDILPRGGSLAAFVSERFAHEVLPASRERIAITGWLRRRA